MNHLNWKNTLLAASLCAALVVGTAPARAQSEASLVLSALPVASVVGVKKSRNCQFCLSLPSNGL